MLIPTGRNASWPPRLSYWLGEHWSYRRDLSGISFFLGGVYVPVSSSYYCIIWAPRKGFEGDRCRQEESIMNPVPFTKLCLPILLLSSLQRWGWNWCTARQPYGVPAMSSAGKAFCQEVFLTSFYLFILWNGMMPEISLRGSLGKMKALYERCQKTMPREP